MNDDGQLQLKLFSLPIEFAADFENGSLSEELLTILSKNLGNQNNISSKKEVKEQSFEIRPLDTTTKSSENERKSKSWQIIDTTNNKTYTLKHEGNELILYQLTLEEIALEVGCSVSEVEMVLHTIQETFEPTGIAYRDLKETLSIQIRNQETQHLKQNGQPSYGNEVPFWLVKRIVEDHLDDLFNSRISTISQYLEVERDKILKASQWIGTLSPYPGRLLF